MRLLAVVLAIAACNPPRPDLSGQVPFEQDGPEWLHKELLPLASADRPPSPPEGSACAGVMEMLPKIESRMRDERAPDPVLDAIDRCFERLGRVPELVGFYRRARAAAPDDARWTARLAGAFVTLGDAAEAMRLLKAAPPDDPACLFLTGLILASQAPTDPQAKRGARDAWRRLLEIAPEHKGLDSVPPEQIRARVRRWTSDLGDAPPPAAVPIPAPVPAPAPMDPAAPPAPSLAPAPVPAQVAAPVHQPGAGYSRALFQGTVALSADRFDAAEAAFRRALELRADDPAALAGLEAVKKKKPAKP